MGEEVFVVVSAGVVVQILMRQAQVGKVAPAKGCAIRRLPERRQVKALGHPLRLPHRQHVVAIGGSRVGAGLPAAPLEKRGGRGPG